MDASEEIAALLAEGLARHREGRLKEACAAYGRVLERQPAHADAMHLTGVAAHQAGRHAEALAWIDRALAGGTVTAAFLGNRGNVLRALDRAAEALASYDGALALDPRSVEATLNRAALLSALGRHAEALAGYDRALELRPDLFEAAVNRANLLCRMARFAEAAADYERLLGVQPASAPAHLGRAFALGRLGRHGEALAAADRGLATLPDDAALLRERAAALQALGRSAEALAACDAAMRAGANDAGAWQQRAVALLGLRRADEALASLDEALRLQPALAEAWNNRGNALRDLGRWPAALEAYERAVALQPDFADAQVNLALCRLTLGRLEEGWAGHEWRRRQRAAQPSPRPAVPAWDGRRVEGTLLVVAEQGVGDEIFHAGMLEDLRERAGAVVACVDRRLVPLFARSFPGMAFHAREKLPAGLACEAQVEMGSLGRFVRAGAADLARVRSSYLRADPDRSRRLREAIARPGELLCGLSWISRNSGFGTDKSLALHDLEPLLALPGLRFVNLQYGDTRAEEEALRARAGLALVEAPGVDRREDLDGLAALAAACDLVVSASNSTAHLAAALGRRTFVLLPRSTGLLWYWHASGDASPWYPTARLFRQRVAGDWRDPVAAVRDAVAAARGG